MHSESAPPGVRPFDHTADVGLDVWAPTLEELFVRAALGTAWLVRGEGPDAGGAARPGETVRGLRLAADDVGALLRAWLRELLYWHETERLAFVAVRFDTLDRGALKASVTVAPDTGEPVREIKGVTLHGLAAERRDGEWTARVIFDV